MIKYIISKNTHDLKTSPRPYDTAVYNGVDKDYRKYSDAPRDYQIKYNFIFHALYSCLTFCNGLSSQEEGLIKFKEFALEVEDKSGLHIKPIKDEKGTISFVVDRRDKVKRYKQNG